MIGIYAGHGTKSNYNHDIWIYFDGVLLRLIPIKRIIKRYVLLIVLQVEEPEADRQSASLKN